MSEKFHWTAAETTSEHGRGVLESAFVPRACTLSILKSFAPAPLARMVLHTMCWTNRLLQLRVQRCSTTATQIRQPKSLSRTGGALRLRCSGSIGRPCLSRTVRSRRLYPGRMIPRLAPSGPASASPRAKFCGSNSGTGAASRRARVSASARGYRAALA